MNEWRFKILYDGECPFCQREVRWLQRLNRHNHLAFEDISSSEFDPETYGASREELLGVIHGVYPDGRIVRKVQVFREAYSLVGLGWLLAPTAWPVLHWAFDCVYSLLARFRIPIGRLIGRSCASGTCSVQNVRRHQK